MGKLVLFVAVVLLSISAVSATELGVNYYHESLYSAWNQPHIPRSEQGVVDDMEHISEISTHVKLFMNPYHTGNEQWITFVSDTAHQNGLHTVVTMMVDDRELNSGNWDEYSAKVIKACKKLDGHTDEILVGNEITLHSPMSRAQIRDKVLTLMDQCDTVFSGEVGYQEFWWAKDVWSGYNERVYWMQYENIYSFEANVKEMVNRWGAFPAVGEWGEDSIDENIERNDWWQREEIEKRWKILEENGVSVAYIFTYREPSWNAFGIINPADQERPTWAYLESLGQGVSEVAPEVPPPTVPDEEETPNESDPTPQEPTQPNQDGVMCLQNGQSCSLTSMNVAGTCTTYVFGSIKAKACEKESGLEVYSLSGNGDYEVCIDDVCVSDENGFGKKSTTDTTPENPTPIEPNEPTTSSDVSCSAQNCQVVSDVTNGCREIQFSSNQGNIKVLACQKDTGAEMYLQQAPSGKFEICLEGGCVSDRSGFARISSTGDGGAGDVLPEEPPFSEIDLHIKEWYPKGHDYIFVCEGASNEVTWKFGDGIMQKTSSIDVYHSYSANGGYTVICESSNGSDTLPINVVG